MSASLIYCNVCALIASLIDFIHSSHLMHTSGKSSFLNLSMFMLTPSCEPLSSDSYIADELCSPLLPSSMISWPKFYARWSRFRRNWISKLATLVPSNNCEACLKSDSLRLLMLLVVLL